MLKVFYFIVLSFLLGFFIPQNTFAEDNQIIFSEPIILQTQKNPLSIATVDMNNDGNKDILVVAHNFESDNVYSYLGQGNGSFDLASRVFLGLGFNPRKIISTDFNEDNLADIAVFGSGKISTYLGQGNGLFSFRGDTIIGDVDRINMISGDFNKDGHTDIAIPNSAFGIAILLGDGGGSFAVMAFDTRPLGFVNTVFMVVADVNKDGNLDLITSNRKEIPFGPRASNLAILLGKGDSTFFLKEKLPISVNFPTSIDIDDYNKDGNLDLAISMRPENQPTETNFVGIIFGDGTGHFLTLNSYAQGTNPVFLKSADFNLDSYPDLAVSSIGTFDSSGVGKLFILLNNNDGTFSSSKEINLPAGSQGLELDISDLDNDNLPDIALPDAFNGVTLIYLNKTIKLISIDIKPGSDPNCINLKSKGSIPVAILGAESLNVSDVDASSLKFADSLVIIKKDGKPQTDLKDINGDSQLDLVAHFKTQELKLSGTETTAKLVGKLKNGQTIRGSDSICFTKGSFSFLNILLDRFLSIFGLAKIL